MSRNFKGSGVGVKKMKKFPLILKYLEAFHKDIYDLFDDLGMEGALIPKRNGAITFLLPSKTYITKIRKSIESDNPEEATDMLLSLIIPDYLDSTAAFTEKQDDIPNLLGKKITIKGVSGNKVAIDDGDLTIDSDFRGFERQGNRKRGNLAVWELKGEVEFQNAPPATFKYLKREFDKTKKPFAKTIGKGEDNISELLRKTCESEIEAIINGKKNDEGLFISPILNAVARIIRGLSGNNDLLLAARCLLTKCHIIDFIILTKTPDIFPSSDIMEAYNKSVDQDNNVDTIKNLFNSNFNDNSSIISNFNKLESVKSNIQSSVCNLGSRLNKIICNIYEELDNSNTLKYENYSVSNVYPKYLSDIFKSNKGSHLALDETKQFLHVTFNKIKNSIPVNSPEWFDSRKTRAEEYRNFFQDFFDCFKITNDPNKSILNMQKLDVKDDKYAVSFCEEGLFLHFPTPTGNFNHLEDRVKYGGNDEDENILDLEYENTLDTFDNSAIKLSECTINELKAYMKSNNGRLPTFN